MANENLNAIEAPGLAGLALPKEGNAKIDPSKTQGSQVTLTGELTAEEKLRVADQLIRDREDKERKEREGKNGQQGKGQQTTKDGNEPSDEEINAKLDVLEKKEDKDLSDEERAFIEKYTTLDTDEITNVRQDIESTYGIKLEGEFDNSPDGLKLLTNAAVPVIAEQLMINALENVPHMKDFYQHIVKEGKSIDTFLLKNTKPQFESIEIKPLSEVDEAAKPKMTDNLKTLVRLDLSNKGADDSSITDLIALYEANGSLYDKAKTAKESLQKTHKAQVDAKIKDEEVKIAAQEQAIAKEFNDVKNMLTVNKVRGVELPKAELANFRDAMLRAVDTQGNTTMDKLRHNLTLEDRVLLDYIVWKQFNINGFSKKAEGTETRQGFNFKKASDDNNRRMGGRVRNTSGNGGSTPTTPGNPDIRNLIQVEKQTI